VSSDIEGHLALEGSLGVSDDGPEDSFDPVEAVLEGVVVDGHASSGFGHVPGLKPRLERGDEVALVGP
jgi:hypothetical protein